MSSRMSDAGSAYKAQVLIFVSILKNNELSPDTIWIDTSMCETFLEIF